MLQLADVCFEIHTKHKNALWGHNLGFRMISLVTHKVTSRL